MDGLLAKLKGGDASTPEVVGVLLALALMLVLRLSLPEHRRSLLRQPYTTFVLHLAGVALTRIVPDDIGVNRVLSPFVLLLLLLTLARTSVLLVIDVLFGRRFARPLPKITRDIVQGLVYAGIGMATLRSAGVEPGSLLTTSALLTAVIGLSLQETLGNLFAGLAIQMQRPFDVGDWIQFDADMKHIGHVVEINWRATKVITLDEVEVIVPNASLAKAPIVNFTKPTLYSRRSIYVHTPYDVPPTKVQEIILAAIANAPGVLAEPAPSVVTNQFADNGIEHWVRFFTDQFHKRDGVDGGVRDRIWYALRRARIAIPYPTHAVELHEVSDESTARVERKLTVDRRAALDCVDFFRVLSEDDHEFLAALTHHRLFGPGEVIVRQGDDDNQLFVIEQGEVAVTVSHAGSESHEVARLGPGKFFGEMALVTGDRRQATVRAVKHCQLLEVPHHAMKSLFAKSPDLAERMSEILAKRQAELDEQAVLSSRSAAHEMEERTSALLSRIRRFFAL